MGAVQVRAATRWSANAEQAAAWAGEGGHWAAHDDRYNASVAAHTARLLAAAAVAPGDRVLDVGCGCGDTTRQAARLAGPAGRALGVDLSAAMVARARLRAREAGLATVEHQQADAQVHPFGTGSFDVAISRFGATYFADPVAAFANLAGAVRPGGRLALLAWQAIERNRWVTALHDALAAGRMLPPPSPLAPSPFAFADPARAAAVLAEAGFTAVAVAAVDDPVHLGADADDAYAFVSGIGLTRGLLGGLEPTRAAAALAALRTALGAAATPGGVRLGSAAWLVTARVPTHAGGVAHAPGVPSA